MLSAIQLRKLEAAAAKLRDSAMAESTRRTRTSQWNQFLRFCKQFDLLPLPASPRVLTLFVTHLAHRGLEYSSILNYLHSLSALHTTHDMAPPDLSHYSVQQVLAGLRRQRENLPMKRAPITLQHLVAIKHNLPSVPRHKRDCFYAACLTAFFTLLRKSNLFFSTASVTYLQQQDLTFRNGAAHLRVRRIKNSKFKNSDVVIPLPPTTSHPLCPTSALVQLSKTFSRNPRDPLFSYTNSMGERVALTATSFVAILRAIFRNSNLDTKLISCHSFRHGAATYAASLEVPTAALKAQGLWRSSCFENYINRDPALRTEFVQQLSAAMQLIKL